MIRQYLKKLTSFSRAQKPTVRPVILHGHMFKNAGSTLDWSLSKNFGSRFIDHRDDSAMRNGGEAYLSQYLSQNTKIKALSSHHMCSVVRELEGIDIYPIYFVRHPIVRARSVYNFERRQPEQTPGSKYAKQHDFTAYVKWRMLPDVNATIRDYQVRYCLPRRYERGPLDEPMFKQAMDVMGESGLLGVVDRYDESAVVFEEALRDAFPKIDLSYVIQNVGINKGGISVEKESKEILKSLDSLGDQLLEQNKFDLKMYAYGNECLNMKISKIQGYDLKLADFRARCHSLSAATGEGV
jgi:hypothetical protein